MPVSGTVAFCMTVLLFWLPFMICVIIYVRIYFIVRRHTAFFFFKKKALGRALCLKRPLIMTACLNIVKWVTPPCRAIGKSGILKIIAEVFGTTLLGFGALSTAICLAYYM